MIETILNCGVSLKDHIVRPTNIGIFLSYRRHFLGLQKVTTWRKVFCVIFVYKFSPAKIGRPFLVWPPKKVFMCFSANLWRKFVKTSNIGRHFYLVFQAFFPDYHQIKLLQVLLHPLEPQPPTTLLFITVSLVISWFIKVDLKQSYCRYSGTQKI